MSNSLDTIERDIGVTRARLATNLSALTSPSTLDDLKDTVKAEALHATDDVLSRVKASAENTALGLLSDLKAKALDNPTAALAIGAGIGWRLWKNPPIATALVGLGLYSLLSSKTPFRSALQDVRERVEDAASDAIETARRTTHELQDKASTLASQTKEATEELWTQARQSGERKASEYAEQARQVVGDPRGQVLLGVAGLAVAAAVGMAVTKYRADDSGT